MSRINVGRVVAGGLAAGVVMNLIDFVANGVLLADHWKAQAANLNARLDAMAPMAIAGYVILDFAVGMLTIWLYAAMRPRFGAGPGTAMRAGVSAWLFNALYSSIFVSTGMYGAKLIIASVAAGLVSALAGAFVGAMVYKEDQSPSSGS